MSDTPSAPIPPLPNYRFRITDNGTKVTLIPTDGIPVDDSSYVGANALQLAIQTEAFIHVFDGEQDDVNRSQFDRGNTSEVSRRVRLIDNVRRELCEEGMIHLVPIICKRLRESGYLIQGNQIPTNLAHIDMIIKGGKMKKEFEDDPISLLLKLHEMIGEVVAQTEWKLAAGACFNSRYNVDYADGAVGINKSRKQHCFINIIGSKCNKAVQCKIQAACDTAFGCGLRTKRSSKKKMIEHGDGMRLIFHITWLSPIP